MSNGAYDPQGLHQRLYDAIGKDALESLGAVISWAHLRAPVVGAELYGVVGKERSGLLRWLQIDSDLLRLRYTHPRLKIEWTQNVGCAGKHVEIVSGDVRLLVSHDQDAEADTPKSEYATTLVSSNQQILFKPDVVPAAPVAEYYTFVLFHSRSEERGSIPRALQIRFPDGAGEYAAESLDLQKTFANLSNETWLQQASLGWGIVPTVDEEKVADTAVPSIRKAKQVGT